MQYRTLGRTGVQVSTLVLGAMNFGRIGRTGQDDVDTLVGTALDAGINLIDTADMYGQGESEEMVGKAIAGRRDDIVLATKATLPMGDDRNRQGGSRRWLITALDDSLRRLGVDHVDLYQMHRWDPRTSDEETLGALTDLQRAGKIRYFGSSTFPAYRIVQAQWAARDGRYVTEQPSYSILQRGVEAHVLPVTEEYGMGVLAWSPLATIADQAGLTLIQLALGFVTAHPAVTSAIIGPRTPEHLAAQLAAADTVLGADLLDAIDAVVPPGLDLAPEEKLDTPPALLEASRRRR
jgi:aryl-alcohol dehydrogenase-like predicted oxidoreductase